MTEEKWSNDVFMRDNLNDTGEVPCADAGWTRSPDIIPNGVNLIEDPVSYLKDNWGRDVGKETILNQQNYFYVRGKNLFKGQREGTFKLYYCPAHLFLYPSLWQDNQLKTSSGSDSLSATVQKENDLVIPNEPFVLPPSSSEEHHCMIGQVITEDHANPIPPAGSIANTDELAKFILDHPNWVWRNVDIKPANIPTFVRTFNLKSGTKDSLFLFQLVVMNIEPGSSVSFSCGTPIPSGPDKGKLIELTKTEVTQPNQTLGTAYLNIPANFNTTITYSYWGKNPRPDWKVSYEAIKLVGPDHELYGHSSAKPISNFGVKTGENLVGIRLGAHHTEGH